MEVVIRFGWQLGVFLGSGSLSMIVYPWEEEEDFA